MARINLEAIWELASGENSDTFEPSFLAELIFSEEADDDIVSAFLRCIFLDRLYFKYKEGKIRAHSPEQVEQLRLQQEAEQKKHTLATKGVQFLESLNEAHENDTNCSPESQQYLQMIRDYYLFGNDAEHADITKQILKESGLHRPHDPFHILVKAGIWNKTENIPLLRQGLPVGFSLAARQQAEALLQSNVESLLDDPARTDFSHLSPLTIDGATTLDFDDALTIEKEGENYLVGIHISDVAQYVRPGDPLFRKPWPGERRSTFRKGRSPCFRVISPKESAALFKENFGQRSAS